MKLMAAILITLLTAIGCANAGASPPLPAAPKPPPRPSLDYWTSSPSTPQAHPAIATTAVAKLPPSPKFVATAEPQPWRYSAITPGQCKNCDAPAVSTRQQTQERDRPPGWPWSGRIVVAVVFGIGVLIGRRVFHGKRAPRTPPHIAEIMRVADEQRRKRNHRR